MILFGRISSQASKKQFEVEVLNLYNATDRKTDIFTVNRHGVLEKFPLLSLTVVVANNQKQPFANIYELTELLALEKKKAKQLRR